jgi:hypothetical protein
LNGHADAVTGALDDAVTGALGSDSVTVLWTVTMLSLVLWLAMQVYLVEAL